MKKNEWNWALAIFVIILLAYIVPFTMLREVYKWYGSFLLWNVLTLIVIGVVYFFTKDWGKSA